MEDLNVFINGLTFLFMQQVQMETPKQDDTHDPIILNGASGKESNNPMVIISWLCMIVIKD